MDMDNFFTNFQQIFHFVFVEKPCKIITENLAEKVYEYIKYHSSWFWKKKQTFYENTTIRQTAVYQQNSK